LSDLDLHADFLVKIIPFDKAKQDPLD
jgi:hypothetical protein